MRLRRKSVRRVGILITAAGLLGAGAVGIAYKQQRQRERQVDADRRAGMAAFLNGDYATAVDPLERVLEARPADDKAVLAFAVARSRVPTRTTQQLRQSVQKLEGLLHRDPHNTAARDALLEIYPQIGNDDALEKLATDVLTADPRNEPALRGRINVLMRRDRLDEALDIARQYAALKAENFQAQTLVLHLMARLKRPPAEAIAFARSDLDRSPDDARALLLMAVASNYAGDQENALSYLQQSAQRPVTDPTFVRQLAGLFDMLHRPEDAQRVLDQAAQRTGDPDILRLLVIRYWQNGRNQEIADRLARFDPATGDAELVALRAMALYQLQQQDKARAIVKALKARPADGKPGAWAIALEARFEDYAEPMAGVVAKLLVALARDPNNGIFSSWIADAYWDLGEAGLALRHWQAASIAMPDWPKPYLGMSQARLRLGRTAEAVEAAETAYNRQPNVSTAINRVLIRYRLIEETGDTSDATKLLGLINDIHARQPNEPRTLPIYVSLLARTGDRAGAMRLLDQAIVADPVPPADTLLALATVSRAENFGRETGLVSRTPEGGVTPRLALARAAIEAESGRREKALADLRAAAAAAPERDAAAWQTAIAEHLDATGDPTGSGVWTSLGTRYAGSLEVQRTILANARSVRGDRAFIEQTINRLRAITGADGQQWKIERAKWLIDSPDVMRDCREAVLILKEIADQSPGLIEPRLQLAKAHERMGNVVAATEHLRAALAVDPRSADVMFELVRLLQQQGQTEQVRDLLRQLSTTAMTSSRQRVTLASMVADNGDAPRAIATLETEAARYTLPAQGKLLLAELYHRAGRDVEATAIYDELLKASAPSPGTRASAAEFYAMTGRIDEARRVLAALAQADAAPLDVALAMARFEERFGDRSAALSYYRRAAETGAETGRLALIDYLLRTKDISQAVAVATQAAEAAPTNTALANRLLEAKALARLKADPSNFAPLIAALSADPTRSAEVDMYKLLNEARSAGRWDEPLIKRLVALAERHPRFEPLQELAVDQLLRAGRTNEAVTVARRAAAASPTAATPGQLSVRTLRAAGRWPEMRAAAEQWKRRSGANMLEPDAAMAEASLNMNNPAEALAVLSPHRERIAGDVRTEPAAAALLARAMTAQGEGESARQMLRPLLGTAAGRRLWLGVARDSRSVVEARAWLSPLELRANADESLAVATVWVTAARRLNDLKLLEESLDLLQPLSARHPPVAGAELLRGGVLLQLGRPDEAETALRNALADPATAAAAANDLAMLLLPRDPGAAEPLARQAVGLAPRVAVYHDTLARVLLAANSAEASAKAFDEALRLDPNLAEARLGKARLLRARGDVVGARREMQYLERQLRGDTASAHRVGNEYATLRDELAADSN